jgi:hypothetical protein
MELRLEEVNATSSIGYIGGEVRGVICGSKLVGLSGLSLVRHCLSGVMLRLGTTRLGEGRAGLAATALITWPKCECEQNFIFKHPEILHQLKEEP